MNAIISAFKREEWMPYVFVGFVLVQTLLMLLSLVTHFGTGGVGTFFTLSRYAWPYPTELMVSILLNMTALLVGMVVFVCARRHDRALGRQERDERELHHDQLVSSRSYKIAVYILTAYAVFLGDVLILLLLVLILALRIKQRITLERVN